MQGCDLTKVKIPGKRVVGLGLPSEDKAPWTSWMFNFGGFTDYPHPHKQETRGLDTILATSFFSWWLHLGCVRYFSIISSDILLPNICQYSYGPCTRVYKPIGNNHVDFVGATVPETCICWFEQLIVLQHGYLKGMYNLIISRLSDLQTIIIKLAWCEVHTCINHLEKCFCLKWFHLGETYIFRLNLRQLFIKHKTPFIF